MCDPWASSRHFYLFPNGYTDDETTTSHFDIKRHRRKERNRLNFKIFFVDSLAPFVFLVRCDNINEKLLFRDTRRERRKKAQQQQQQRKKICFVCKKQLNSLGENVKMEPNINNKKRRSTKDKRNEV